MMSVRNICFTRSNRHILNDISFDIRPGEFLVVLGPNGAGKSTLLGLLSGTSTPDAGTLTFNDRPLSAYDGRELARLRSVVRQSTSVSLPYTVFDLVLLGRMPHTRGRDSADDREIALQALHAVQAGDLVHRAYATLSGGEQQRVHIARALAQITWRRALPGSRLMLLDEPTAHLDIGQSHRLLHLLRDLRSATLAVVAVLHDISLAARYADRIILLHNGGVSADGAPADVVTADAVKTLYGIDAAVNRCSISGAPVITPLPPHGDNACGHSRRSDRDRVFPGVLLH